MVIADGNDNHLKIHKWPVKNKQIYNQIIIYYIFLE